MGKMAVSLFHTLYFYALKVKINLFTTSIKVFILNLEFRGGFVCLACVARLFSFVLRFCLVYLILCLLPNVTCVWIVHS